MKTNKFIREVKTKMITIENEDGKPLSGWQLSAILFDTNDKYRIRTVVTSNDGKILRVDCLTTVDEK